MAGRRLLNILFGRSNSNTLNTEGGKDGRRRDGGRNGGKRKRATGATDQGGEISVQHAEGEQGVGRGGHRQDIVHQEREQHEIEAQRTPHANPSSLSIRSTFTLS
ncbi:hypothetical protein SLE2022_127270 [Rubroshorea leprosula]